MLGTELIPLTAASFAVSKMIARERIGSWVREPFVDDPVGPQAPARRQRPPRARRARHVQPLRRRVDRARLRQPAPRTPARGPHRDRRSSRSRASTTSRRRAFRGLCDWANTSASD